MVQQPFGKRGAFSKFKGCRCTWCVGMFSNWSVFGWSIKENERMYKFHFCLDCSYFDLTYAAKVRRTDKRCTFVKVKVES